MIAPIRPARSRAVRDYGCGFRMDAVPCTREGKARNRVAFIAHQSIGQFELLA